MQTILVPVAGSASDAGVLSAASVLAHKLGADLDCLHVNVDPATAAFNTPHVGSARGAAVANAFRDLREKSSRRLAAASETFKAFCAEHGIALDGARGSGASATWREASGDAVYFILNEARHHDLTIMGRPGSIDGLPRDRLETVLMASGRPLLVMPPEARLTQLETPVICWKETPEAARAVKAAMPLLKAAGRAIVISIREKHEGEPTPLLGYLKRHGVEARYEPATRGRDGVYASLENKARELKADLIIMGGYGRSRLQEFVFGGVTQTALGKATLPVFIMH